MRIVLALIALTTLTACRVITEPFYGDRDNCESGYSRSGGSCTRNYQPPVVPAVPVISIGPSRVYADSADSLCYQLSPTPASIRQGDSYRFQNNTGFSVTIVGSDGIPWVTVGAWSTSPPLGSSAPGVYGFGLQGCRGAAGTAWYGILDVTVN
ncbi:MAG TPA: hypothetical protein VGI97_00830 [Gemmatimonadaceae bacterium]